MDDGAYPVNPKLRASPTSKTKGKTMKSIIDWHETAKELPEPTNYEKALENGKTMKWKVDEPLLVIWEGKVKPSRYLSDTQTWEGHTKEQTPAYWVMLKEINILTEQDND